MSTTLAPDHVDGHPIERRMVRFDWSDTKPHWVPDDPLSTHVINVLHLLLPAGERWFIDVVLQARDKVSDDELKAAIKPFTQQESWHANAHAAVLDHLAEQGIETEAYTKRLQQMFQGRLADHPNWPAPLRDWWRRRNLGVVAAIEHFTAVLGDWILHHHALDEAGADPVMLDLLRWHGAEEVEHRSLVFDVHQAVGGSYAQRVTTMVTTLPIFTAWWIAGVRYLWHHDPSLEGRKLTWRGYLRAARQGRLPTPRQLFGDVPTYLKPGFNPAQQHSTEEALEYMATSPAAKAARERRDSSGSESNAKS
jgi:predicted metal-dependent hydrolase